MPIDIIPSLRPTEKEKEELAYAWVSFRPEEHVLPRTKSNMGRMREIFDWINEKIDEEISNENSWND